MKRIKKYWERLLNLLKKQGNVTLSTETNLTSSVTPKLQNQPDYQSQATFHHSIQTLFYSDYLTIVLTGDLSKLIIKGTPAPAELTEAWANIQLEYSDSIKSPKGNSVFEVGKKLLYNNWKINLVSLCVEMLKDNYDLSIAEKLAESGYDFIQDLPDRAEYLKQIYAVETEAKFLIVQKNQLHNEYMRISNNDKPIVKLEMVDYEKELRILSKYMGYAIRKEQITVIEFCSIVNAYLDEIESVKSLKNE